MRWTLQDELKKCKGNLKQKYGMIKRDKWIKDYFGQLCIIVSQIQWTVDVEKVFRLIKDRGDKKVFKIMKKKQVVMFNKLFEVIWGKLEKMQRFKIVVFVIIEIYVRDIIEKLIKGGVFDENVFEWLSQFRFYWEKVRNFGKF